MSKRDGTRSSSLSREGGRSSMKGNQRRNEGIDKECYQQQTQNPSHTDFRRCFPVPEPVIILGRQMKTFDPISHFFVGRLSIARISMERTVCDELMNRS
jgi:hypothetical protein